MKFLFGVNSQIKISMTWYSYPFFDKNRKLVKIDANVMYDDGGGVRVRSRRTPSCGSGQYSGCKPTDGFGDDLDSFELDQGLEVCLYDNQDWEVGNNAFEIQLATLIIQT